MNNIFDKLKTKRKEKGYSLEAVQETLKADYDLIIDKSNISRYENGKVKTVDAKVIKALCKIYGLDYIEVFKELGFIDRECPYEENHNLMKVPLYSSASAGLGCLADSDPIGSTYFPKTNGDLVSVKVDGDSMEPTFKDGQYIIVKKEVEVNSGDVGVFLHKVTGECVVKRLEKKEGKYFLSSDNPKYSDKEILSESIVCCGKVIGITDQNVSKKKLDPLYSLIDNLPIGKRSLAEKLLMTLFEEDESKS
ncbi:putative phage associated-repressor [Propionigenium maris DSM 9537]|uniref:Phage associated-repressor n=1 Tax=Propionigenium maris DSM 9537 TaxID=1123000 RepID=A0A9W6GII5_9FUSO|nr:LexA family transcriptional regulator [Propionigenium maris]GLI54524.1 putative phage associated-repressor [Propionigenium maris DSM 9537]